MGVPKFFRYISERYPCLSELVKEYQIPEFDNLYLDMNGIIHMCSHPDDNDPHFRISEEKIFEDIFHYIEVLFRMIKPQKLFFMAVDGVAPRAKMNQQRGRRFNSAKEAQRMEEAAKKKGEVLPDEARFDSNCITPGTPFMARLHEQLKYFVVNKISTDKTWSKCKIILSGHETPGEGEHKIMDYIRYLRSQPGYDPNTRHCLYGLDADLIMLGLCTHEPHFSLLREEVKFGKKSTKRKNVPEEITFYLLHLSLMREYLELEFQTLKDGVSFKFDIENIIDDWVLMGFLVGNDFIPNLPNLHIANGALPILYNTYMKVLPSLGGYINEGGALNLPRFEEFMKALSEIDMENFQETYADMKYFEAKTGRRYNERERISYKPIEVEEKEENKVATPPTTEVLEPSIENLQHLALQPDGFEVYEDEFDPEDLESDISSSSNDDFMTEEFRLHKQDYYMNKLEYEQVTPKVLRDQAEGYVKAIQWNLNYYYNGCCSWSWYYPHHYAPYISDIRGFADLKIEFDLGQPFRPFEQLLAVLPAASRELLPTCYQELMTSEDSRLKKYYPEEFRKDLNGKKQDWEAVVLIPFIDQKLLLDVMEPLNQKLTEDEKKRNSHGPMLVYNYTEDGLGTYFAPSYFPPVKEVHAHCVALSIDDIKVPVEKLIKGAYPGVVMDVYYPGFPTFKHLKYTASLEKAKVRVFEQPSRGENMIVKLEPREYEQDFIKNILGNVVHVGWPHLVEALVLAISTRNYRYISLNDTGDYKEVSNKESVFEDELRGIAERYKCNLGVDVGRTECLLHVKVMTGRKYTFSQHGRITLKKQFAEVQSHYPLQTIVRNLRVYDQHNSTYHDIASIFPPGASCFMLGHPHYGAMGEILDDPATLEKGRVKIQLRFIEEPKLGHLRQLEMEANSKYMSLFVACSRLSISRYVFSRITGTVFIMPVNQLCEEKPSRRINVGLNLKFNVKNQETPGFTKKVNNNWMYSEKTVNLIKEYLEFCPKIFEYLQYNQKADNIILEEIFPENSEEKLKELVAWLKSKPHYNAERQTSGNLIMDPEIVKCLEDTIDAYRKKEMQIKLIGMRVKPQLLYRSELQFGHTPPDPDATYELCDRVVNVREGHSVPMGAKGTIIGIRAVDENDKLYDVVFDSPFLGGLAVNCSNGRGYRLPAVAMINISYGSRVYQNKTGVPGRLVEAVQTTKQNPSKPPPPNPGYRLPLPSAPVQPPLSAFASWNKMSPRMPYQNFFPLLDPRTGFVQPGVNMPFNQPFMGQPLMKTVVLKHDTPKNQPNYTIKQAEGPRGENVAMLGHAQNGREGPKMDVVKSPLKNSREAANQKSVQSVPETAPINNTTDLLKKMLKINEDLNAAAGSSEPKLPGKSISLDEVFAKAKTNQIPLEHQFQRQSDCVQLVSYFQSHNLGCPQYQYFKNRGGIVAQVSIPGDRVFTGKPCRNKEEASEAAAREALNYLMKAPPGSVSLNRAVPNARSPQTFPTPPRQWYNKKTSNERVIHNSTLKDVNTEQKGSPPKANKLFVPLQAVRGSGRVPTRRNIVHTSDKNNSETVTTASNQPQNENSQKKETAPVQVKRRERKSRLAANFAKKNMQVKS